MVEEDYLMESRDQLVEDHYPSFHVVEADHQCVLVVGSNGQLVVQVDNQKMGTLSMSKET